MKTFLSWFAVMLLGLCGALRAADLPVGFHTLSEAVVVRARVNSPAGPGLTGWLGVVAAVREDGSLIAEEVAENLPAAVAGVSQGDVIVDVAGSPLRTADELRAFLQAKAPGERVALTVRRGAETRTLSATLSPTSLPLRIADQRGVMGVRMNPGSEEAGVSVASVTRGRPADLAGLRAGDTIEKVDGVELSEALALTDALAEKRPGDKVCLNIRRKEQAMEKTVTLVADEGASSLSPDERRVLKTWAKDTYRMAVICVEYPDLKHHPKIAAKDWSDAFFSTGSYQMNAFGEPVFGSMNDYYVEQSCGRLRVEGRVFDWVEVKKNRADYNQGTSAKTKAEFYKEAVDTLLAREGPEALAGFDGIGFIYAGEKFPTTNRGSLYWPHRSSFTHELRSWPYVIVPELRGKDAMSTISTMCHETGHILGLPDLYARPENPGSEGVGSWCAMSNQKRDGRPQHFSAWCKEQLGWLQPVTIDPTVRQKLVLGPVEGSTGECLKVLVRPDGSEYFLLENRTKTGFDASLPAEGLLIWRVVANRPALEEAHGVAGPPGPRVYLNSVPYPSRSNQSFTPYTTPSSRSQLGGGLPVFISNIRKLGDGRVALEVGYQYQ